MNDLRIVSFLPSATEMVCALGLADRLVGLTHECDYPPEIRTKPVVVRPAIPLGGLSLQEIDGAVSARIRSGESLYQVDEKLLRQLAPTLILTQNLCQVCAPSGTEITQALKLLQPQPRILWFTPTSLAGIEENLRELGQATGREQEADAVIASGRERLERVAALTRKAPIRPRVFCMEWVDPIYCSGHWVPEMVELAGGIDALSRKGTDSVRIAWRAVTDWAPEVLVISPCGFNLSAAANKLCNSSKTQDGTNCQRFVKTGFTPLMQAPTLHGRDHGLLTGSNFSLALSIRASPSSRPPTLLPNACSERHRFSKPESGR